MSARKTGGSGGRVLGGLVAAVALAGAGAGVVAGATSAGALAAVHAASSRPPAQLAARRLRARRHAVRPGTAVRASRLGTRAFANSKVGVSLAEERGATYPVRTVDGGRVWRVDGPQLHVNAADAPEAVDAVGLRNSRTYFAYGSSAVDVTDNGGRSWWEAFMGDLVVAVVPAPKRGLLAYVQDATGGSSSRTVIVQYVSRDGGRHWRHSTAFGG